MGRPKGSLNKSKETEMNEVNGNVIETVTEVVEPVNTTSPADKAYSIVFDPKTHKFSAVEVLFDFQSGTFGGLKVIEQNTNKNIINERFQVLVAQNLL